MNDLTICQIERRAELAMDALDRRLMNRLITQAAYDAAVKALDAETERLWKTARRTIDVAY
jgi:hypothetical protein